MASQMADAEMEKTIARIIISTNNAELAALKSGNRRALRQLGLPEQYAGRPLSLWRGKDEAGYPGNNLNPQRVNRPSTTEAGVARRR
jgi:hypothetical protein